MADNGFTPIPNCLLDKMAEMKPAEFKALMAIYRLIIGYKEYRDSRRRHISITKLQKFIGLSRQGVINAMAALEEYGYVTKVETGGVNEWVVNSFDQKEPENSQDSLTVVNSVDGISQDSLPPSNEKKEIKENKKKKHADEALIAFFEGMTAFTPPYETTDAYAEEWLQPIQAILSQSADYFEAEKRLTWAIQEMRRKRYTIKSPKSCLTMALNWQESPPAPAGNGRNSSSADVWELALQHARRGDSSFSDPALKAAVRAFGWRKLQDIKAGDENYYRKDFMRIYHDQSTATTA